MPAKAFHVTDGAGWASRVLARATSAPLPCERRGNAMVEFALIAPVFVCLIMFIIELGYDLFAQSVLDFALLTATRALQVGQAQGASDITKFKNQYFCPALRALLPCNAIAVNIVSVTTDYYSVGSTANIPIDSSGNLNTSGYKYCPGGPGSLMLAQAIYPGPSIVGLFMGAMVTQTKSGPVHVTLSSVAYANESYPVTGAGATC